MVTSFVIGLGSFTIRPFNAVIRALHFKLTCLSSVHSSSSIVGRVRSLVIDSVGLPNTIYYQGQLIANINPTFLIRYVKSKPIVLD